jgi:hypothetical protein
VDGLSANTSKGLTITTIMLMAVNVYVLFSTLPFFYKLGIMGFVFVLLLLFSIAFQNLQSMEQSRRE